MYDALLVVSFGGPEKPEDVLPFLQNVTRGAISQSHVCWRWRSTITNSAARAQLMTSAGL